MLAKTRLKQQESGQQVIMILVVVEPKGLRSTCNLFDKLELSVKDTS